MTKTSKLMIGTAVVAVLGLVAIGAVSHAHERGYGMRGYGGPAYGHGGGHGAPMMNMMERFDTDGDGKLTRAEIEAERAKRMAMFDTDKDGALSLDEFQPMWNDLMRQRMVQRFQRHDTDGDGKITQAEIDRHMSRIMTWMDRNDDGMIDKSDMRRKRWYHDDDDDDDDDDKK